MTSLLTGITIVFAAAWCAAALLHRASASTRHVVWTCAIAASLLLAPLRWRLPQRAIAAPVPVAFASATAATVRPASRPHHSTDPTQVLLILWAAGTLVMALRLARNAIRLRSIVIRAAGHSPILTTSRIRGPVVAGILNPLILLPETSSTWTRARRRAVLAHESAHIRRHDPAILFAAHIATALYACDDAALRTGLQPSGYAGHLLDLARRFDIPLAIPMATTSHLESRVKSILNPQTNRSFPARAAWCAAIALTAATLTPLSTLTLHAQQTAAGTATISGTVSDPTGAVVPRVNLTASNADLTYEVQTVSDEVGAYSFHNLPPGHYTVEARAPGFALFRIANLALVSGGRLQADAHLSLGQIMLHSVVTAQSPNPQLTGAAAVVPRPIRVGGNVQPAKVIYRVDAPYPADLQAQGVEGTVVMQAILSKEGIPLSLTLQNTGVNTEFVNAAKTAFSQWRFQPTTLNGEPVEIMTTLQYDFKLGNQAPVIDDRMRKSPDPMGQPIK